MLSRQEVFFREESKRGVLKKEHKRTIGHLGPYSIIYEKEQERWFKKLIEYSSRKRARKILKDYLTVVMLLKHSLWKRASKIAAQQKEPCVSRVWQEKI